MSHLELLVSVIDNDLSFIRNVLDYGEWTVPTIYIILTSWGSVLIDMITFVVVESFNINDGLRIRMQLPIYFNSIIRLGLGPRGV